MPRHPHRTASLLALALVLAALLGACGGTDEAAETAQAEPKTPATTSTEPAPPTTGDGTWTARVVTPDGPDADWATLFLPAEAEPDAVVVFLHGWTDLDPGLYRPWIEHLTGRGDAVVFVDYQASLLSTPDDMLAGAERGIRAGLSAARAAGADGPVAAVGYSLGGALAVQYAARASAWGVEEPAAVYGVFPAPILDDARLPAVPRATSITLVVGDRDSVVGAAGAADLVERVAPHPVEVVELVSDGERDYGHLAPRTDAPYVRETIWAPFDAIVDAARVADRG